MPKRTEAGYGDKEAKRRFEAALRGSREVGHKPMKSMTPKQPKPQPKRRKAKVSA